MSAPTVYACGTCGVKGVRLWREYQTFLDHQTFECRACAMKSQKKTEADVGRYAYEIGWRVLAVPDPLPVAPEWELPAGYTCWGYTSVPPEGLTWWDALPTEMQ